MITVPTETCSCGSVGLEVYDHASDCDLMAVEDFLFGLFDWSPTLFSLVPHSPSSVTPAQIRAKIAAQCPTCADGNELCDECWTIYLAWQNVYTITDDEPPAVTTKKQAELLPVTSTSSTVSTFPKSTYISTYQHCSHVQVPLVLPDRTVIYASSHHQRADDEPTPDLGVYLAGCWTPDTIAYHVGCPDYGIPLPSVAQVLWIAREALRWARDGRRVEVGCIGGHGRTGLMLGILHCLTAKQPSGKRAVKWVRKAYCEKAIESATQEWYVAGIGCELRGAEWPPRPVQPTCSTGFKSTYDGKMACGKCRGWCWDDESCAAKKGEDKRFPPVPVKGEREYCVRWGHLRQGGEGLCIDCGHCKACDRAPCVCVSQEAA